MGHIKIFGKTKIEGKTVFPPPPLYDSTAAAYIAAVEAADGQALENSIKTAYNDFIVGCKADGIWGAIKASCILAGARTLSGALVPLVGTAPTNFNFVGGDYIRKTGLKGNGSTKYLNTNVAGNSSLVPQNNVHASIYATTGPTVTATGAYLGNANNIGTPGSIGMLRGAGSSLAFDVNAHSATSTRQFLTSTPSNWAGFKAVSRSNSTQVKTRNVGVDYTYAVASATRTSGNISVFRLGAGVAYGNGTYFFYSIGESLDLALLDTRVSALMTAINAAI
jgi:hypothetical protein